MTTHVRIMVKQVITTYAEIIAAMEDPCDEDEQTWCVNNCYWDHARQVQEPPEVLRIEVIREL